MVNPSKTRRILGVEFFTGTVSEAVSCALEGGLVVAPSAPGLAVDLVRSSEYREALMTADLVLTDSGYMILLWRWIVGESLPRHSGLKFIRALLKCEEIKNSASCFWVMPSEADAKKNTFWLRAQGFIIRDENVYVAPQYADGKIVDAELFERIDLVRPRYIFLAIGGGVQERLGHSLRDALAFRPSIFCLGAAIAFITGAQVKIPPWADSVYLGWLFRLLRNPSKYCRRFLRALPLAFVIFNYRSDIPDMKS